MANSKKDIIKIKVIQNMKVFGWSVSILLVILIGGFIFIHLSPGYDAYLVRSESMKPAINMGNIIVTGHFTGEVKPGMVVTYERNEQLITHRVLSVNNDTLVTKGDAMEDPDPWAVTLSSVKGVYLFQIPFIGYMSNFMRTKQGWFLLIIIPAFLLVSLLIKGIVKEALRKEEETCIPVREMVRATNMANIVTVGTQAKIPQEMRTGVRVMDRPVIEAPKVSMRVSDKAVNRTYNTNKVLKKVFENSMKEFDEWLNEVEESNSKKGGIDLFLENSLSRTTVCADKL